jgi:hypothetical protein
MKLATFPEQNATLAKAQPPYIPMPVYVANEVEGRIVCCWRLSFRERIQLLFSGRVWHQVLTFHNQLQPQLLTISKPRNMTWNLPQSQAPTPTLSPAASSPDASTTSDASAQSHTTFDPAPLQNSGVSGSFSSALRGTNSSSQPSQS